MVASQNNVELELTWTNLYSIVNNNWSPISTFKHESPFLFWYKKMCIVAQNEWGHIYTSETRRKAIRPFVSFIILAHTSNTWNRYGPGPILAHKRERRAEGSGTGEAALLELWKWGKRILGKRSRRRLLRQRTRRHRHYRRLLPKQGLYSHSLPTWFLFILFAWFIRASLSP